MKNQDFVAAPSKFMDPPTVKKRLYQVWKGRNVKKKNQSSSFLLLIFYCCYYVSIFFTGVTHIFLNVGPRMFNGNCVGRNRSKFIMM